MDALLWNHYRILLSGIFQIVKYMHSMFYDCSSLQSFPNSVEWGRKITNGTLISNMFEKCNRLKPKPDLSHLVNDIDPRIDLDQSEFYY